MLFYVELFSVIHVGHNLLEVRQRSLQNILSKLHNGIIQYEDLVHHQNIYSCLMEWLNRNEEVTSVLELLATLSKVIFYIYFR